MHILLKTIYHLHSRPYSPYCIYCIALEKMHGRANIAIEW